MLDSDEVKRRLEGVNPQLCAAFAARCSLRVLPFLAVFQSKEVFGYWREKDRSKYLFNILAAQQASVILSSGPIVYKRFQATASSTSTSAMVAVSAFDISPATAAAAAAATSAAAASATAASHSVITTAASTYGTAAHAIKAAPPIAPSFNESILSDLNEMTKTRNLELLPLDLLSAPLWVSLPPKEWKLPLRFFAKALALNAGFNIWVDWYQDRLDGKPLDLELEAKWFAIPAEVKAQGASASNAYLASLRSGESKRPLNLVRGIFIGPGDAGKTSLIKALHGEEVVEGKVKMTPGIAIREWPVPDTAIKARFWDFGGQVMSHSTHQFFLRERCLYILVLDARAEFNANDQAEYWLEHVKAFGKEASVMLVGNKSDLTEVNLNMNALKEKYPNIVDFYPLSCTSKKQKFKNRFATFRTDLIEQLQAVGTHQMFFTDNQFKALEAVRKESQAQAFLPYEGFDRLCQENEIGNRGFSQKDFLGLLDILGEIIHFPKLIRLNAFVLNPRWLTYGVYTLLYADKASEQLGELSEKDVVDILQHEVVKDEHANTLDFPADKCGFIIDAMEDFKLCYRLADGSGRFVIPDKLPSELPELTEHFDKTQLETLAFEFDFRGLLPRHVMPTLIVTRHDDIHENLVWQNGVVLQNQRLRARARVQVDYNQRVLQLWLQGEGKREFLEILNDEINKILQRMVKLEYDEMVILPRDALIKDERLGVPFVDGLEKASYKRLVAEARAGHGVTTSDSGTNYDLQQVMGFIMSKEQRDKAGMNVTVHGNVGAIGGTGKNQKVTGKIIIKKSDEKAISELQTHLTNLMEHIQVYKADFEIKANAYGELKQIREHLDNLEEASPETKGKLRQLLESVKDGSLSAVKLGNEIRDADDTMTWLMDKAVIVSALLAGVA